MDKIELQKLHLILLLFIILITPLGFITKFYNGPAQTWVADNLSGVIYEIFWCLVLKLFFTRWRNGIIAGAVLGMTTILEFLQLWHPPLLESIRQNFLGRTLIGNSFSWIDIPHYVVGCILGWVLLQLSVYIVSPERSSSSPTNSAK